METLKFMKTDCGVEVLLNVLHFSSTNNPYLKKRPFNTDFFEIVFLKKARGKLLLNDRQIELTPNSILFLSPFQNRQWHLEEGELDLTILLFQEDFLNDFFADKLFAYRLLYFYQPDFPQKLEVERKLIETCCGFLTEIKSELVEPRPDSVHIIRSLLYYILQKLNREYAEKNRLRIDREQEHYAFQFRRLLELHIRKKQRVNDYAEMLGITRVSLNKAVREQFRVTASHLLKQRLLQEVKNELFHSTRSVSEIAHELGFSEPNHLMRFFKTQTGMTTGEFLQVNQQ